MQKPFVIKRVAVLGAGVMGAQIAAHCVNAGIDTLLFDLPADENNHYGIVNSAIKNLGKLKPTPLATVKTNSLLKPRNYEDDIADLGSCDLIIEAIAERQDWKKDLYHRITPHLSETAILVTNTSGLSVNKLANTLPEELLERFCGIHFFNPPRYMHLAELIPSKTTPATLLDNLETWLTRYLGKGVIRAKDTPNFIANRIGVFSLLSTIHNADKMGIGLDEVDALTGTLLGRPKSATFRTMDVVGLDTMAHVVHTMQEQLTDDPWHEYFKLPDWLMALIDDGHLGQKSGQGVYVKQNKTIEVYDIPSGTYRQAKGQVSDAVQQIMKQVSPVDIMQSLFASDDRQAQFLTACFRDLFHYCAYHLQAISNTTRDVDLAMRWGFGWSKGPFESWQLFGFKVVTDDLRQAIEAGTTMTDRALPEWLDTLDAFYTKQGAFSPKKREYLGRSELAVYNRQFFPDRVISEPKYDADTLYENEGVRLRHLKDDVVVINFKSKANTVDKSVIDGFNEAFDLVEKQYKGLIVYQENEHNYSSGADLRHVATLIQSGDMKSLEAMISDFQALAMRLKYSPVPVVAALRGRALGGGCELMMHCDRIAAGFESYPGLVEAGVGLIPAGGGCKEITRRAALEADNSDLMVPIKRAFEQVAMAIVAGSAPDARQRGYLQPYDNWVMHKNEVLFSALAAINMLDAQNYVPPVPTSFRVAGREGHAMLQVGLVNWLEGGFISQHDYFLANQLASVLCGGDVNEGALVDEQWLLKLEKEAFMTLAATDKTQARINHLLKTGKPLRN